MLIDTLSISRAASLLISDQDASWSYAGAYALCEYLEELSEDIREPMEFDPVAFRCDFSEYPSLWDWAAEYFGNEPTDLPPVCVLAYLEGAGDGKWTTGTANTCAGAIRDYITDRGTLIEFDGGIIVSSF